MVIATGQFGQAVRPDRPGLDGYGGEQMHSSRYRSGRDFRVEGRW